MIPERIIFVSRGITVFSSADNSRQTGCTIATSIKIRSSEGTLNARLNIKYINSECASINAPEHTQKMTVISGLPQSSGWLITGCIQQLDRYTMIRVTLGQTVLSARARSAAPQWRLGSHNPNETSCVDVSA